MHRYVDSVYDGRVSVFCGRVLSDKQLSAISVTTDYLRLDESGRRDTQRLGVLDLEQRKIDGNNHNFLAACRLLCT